MAGFEIEGERFEVPTLDSLTLRECRIVYQMTDPPIVQEDFEAADPSWPEAQRREHVERNLRLIQRPDFKTALATIAYRRKHPDVLLEDAEGKAEDANGLAVTVALILGGDDVDPTRRTSTPSQNELEIASGT